jgi:hypothetical protein
MWLATSYLIRRYRNTYTAYFGPKTLGTFAKLKLAQRACQRHDDVRQAEAYCRDLERRLRRWRVRERLRLKPYRRRK